MDLYLIHMMHALQTRPEKESNTLEKPDLWPWCIEVVPGQVAMSRKFSTAIVRSWITPRYNEP